MQPRSNVLGVGISPLNLPLAVDKVVKAAETPEFQGFVTEFAQEYFMTVCKGLFYSFFFGYSNRACFKVTTDLYFFIEIH